MGGFGPPRKCSFLTVSSAFRLHFLWESKTQTWSADCIQSTLPNILSVWHLMLVFNISFFKSKCVFGRKMFSFSDNAVARTSIHLNIKKAETIVVWNIESNTFEFKNKFFMSMGNKKYI